MSIKVREVVWCQDPELRWTQSGCLQLALILPFCDSGPQFPPLSSVMWFEIFPAPYGGLEH